MNFSFPLKLSLIQTLLMFWKIPIFLLYFCKFNLIRTLSCLASKCEKHELYILSFYLFSCFLILAAVKEFAKLNFFQNDMVDKFWIKHICLKSAIRKEGRKNLIKEWTFVGCFFFDKHKKLRRFIFRTRII